MSAPLRGITVLDLSRVLAGPYATQLLGDLGADVWKVERPGTGDETRAWGPPFVGEHSAYYLSVNRNKRSAALDLTDAGHLAAVRRAAERADVVVENFLPGTLERFGLDARSLRRERPELVVCSISGYGQDGPYASLPGYDAILQGFTGLQSVTGEPDGPPLKVGVELIDVLAGTHAAVAILATLAGRLAGGRGAHLDVSLLEVGVASMVNVAQSALVTGEPARRHGTAHPNIVPYQTFATFDGAVVVAVGNDAQWQRLCAALGARELAREARYATNPERVLHRSEIVGALTAHFARAGTEEWVERLRAARVPVGPVRDMAEVVRDPQLASRGMVQRADPDVDAGPDLLAVPWRIDGRRPPLRRAPPALGVDTAAFLDRFGGR